MLHVPLPAVAEQSTAFKKFTIAVSNAQERYIAGRENYDFVLLSLITKNKDSGIFSKLLKIKIPMSVKKNWVMDFKPHGLFHTLK